MKNKVLFITQHLPFPPCSGARRREYELLKHLAENNSVTLLAVSKVFDDDERMIQYMDLDIEKVYLYHANPEKTLSEANTEDISLQVYRNLSQAAKHDLPKIIREHRIDVIHIEGFYMWFILPEKLSIPVVLCEQNIEYDIWSQQVLLHGIAKRDYSRQAEIVKRQEHLVWGKVSKIITVTDSDASVIKEYGVQDVFVVSNGYDHSPLLSKKSDGKLDINGSGHSLLYVGNFDYKPNEDAAFYFIKEVFPLIRNILKDVKVYFVGNIGTSKIEVLRDEDIYVTGRVDNLSEYYRRCSIFICPLRYGGGIKTKILEALFASKSIVTTSIGLQGIPNPAISPFVIADNPSDFANGVISLLTDDAYRERREKA